MEFFGCTWFWSLENVFAIGLDCFGDIIHNACFLDKVHGSSYVRIFSQVLGSSVEMSNTGLLLVVFIICLDLF